MTLSQAIDWTNQNTKSLLKGFLIGVLSCLLGLFLSTGSLTPYSCVSATGFIAGLAYIFLAATTRTRFTRFILGFFLVHCLILIFLFNLQKAFLIAGTAPMTFIIGHKITLAIFTSGLD